MDMDKTFEALEKYAAELQAIDLAGMGANELLKQLDEMGEVRAALVNLHNKAKAELSQRMSPGDNLPVPKYNCIVRMDDDGELHIVPLSQEDAA